MLSKILRFIEDRTGLQTAFSQLTDVALEGGPHWRHVFGSALGALFLVQCLTGTALMLHYAPTVDAAWASVFFIQHQVAGGWFVRGLHAYAANAMLIIVGVHMLHVVLAAAYKKPREVTWWLGLALMGLLLGLIITGYRLPWDQRTYWALKVEANITGAMPVVGDALNRLIAGGAELGQATITRLYTLHVVALPALFIAILAFKARQIRRHGLSAPTPEHAGRDLPGGFARQLVINLSIVALLLVALSMLTVVTGGETLDAPAEPDRFYPARPEWFLLPLYKFRMLLPPSMELVATAVVPALGGLFLFALPLIDRGPHKLTRKRFVFVGPVVLGLIGMVALIGLSLQVDASDAEHQAQLAEAALRAERSIELAKDGIPPQGPIYMLDHDPLTRGRDVYRQYCNGCHVMDDEGERKSPDHDGFGSRAWIMSILREPQGEHNFGNVEHSTDMPSQSKLGADKLNAITEFVFSLGVATIESGPNKGKPELPFDASLAKKGEELFRKECMDCHLYEGDGAFIDDGPNLTAYGSLAWVRGQIEHAQREAFYGEMAKMPRFDDQLSAHDIDMVAKFLRLQRTDDDAVGTSTPPPAPRRSGKPNQTSSP